MAIIKIVKAGKTKTSLKNALNYISNEEKITLPNGQKLITPLNCWGNIKNIYQTMIATKEIYRKAINNKNSEMYKHFQQSFKPNEVQSQIAHKIGIEWANDNFAKRGFELCICTHIDKDHIHNHIIINSVNALTGKTIEIHANRTLEELKLSSDTLCRKYNLSVIDRKNSYNKNVVKSDYDMKKRQSILNEKFRQISWQKKIYDIIKISMENSKNKGFFYFEQELKKQNIEIEYKRIKKDIIFRDINTNKIISDIILEQAFAKSEYFLRKNIEKTIGKIPEYNIDINEILSNKKLKFYKLIQDLIIAIDNIKDIKTKIEFYVLMEKQGWLTKETLTGKAFFHVENNRLLYDNTIYKITKNNKYCLAYIESNLK